MQRVNVAVVGIGYWGKKIVHEYSILARHDLNVSLYMVCDLLRENLEFCKGNGAMPFVTSHREEVMACPEVNAINVCTPNETHFKICEEALSAGKHVLVEKPMTLKSSDAYELVDLARARNLVLSVGHIFRFNNALREVRTLIRDGFFGEVFSLKLQWTTLIPPIKGRDIVTDLAPHPFDILNFLLDAWPSKITCKAKTYRRKRLEEAAYILAEFNHNVMAHIELSWLCPGKVREVSVIGSERFAKIDCIAQKVKVFDDGRLYDFPVQKNNTIKDELEHFVSCIQNNDSNNHYLNHNSGRIGANVVRLLEATRKSIEEERTKRVYIE